MECPTEPILGAKVLFIGPLAIAAIIVCASYLRRQTAGVPPEETRISQPMGPSSWDFTRSWASNLTILGAVVGTILAQFPWCDAEPDSRRAFYTATCLFWGLVITLAPASYNLIRDVEEPSRRTGGRTTFHGYVGGFVLASLFTTYGALGEFGTLAALTYEMQASNFIPPEAALGFMILLSVLFFGICFYVYRNVPLTLRYQVLTARYRKDIEEAALRKAERLRSSRRGRTANPLSRTRLPSVGLGSKSGERAMSVDISDLLEPGIAASKAVEIPDTRVDDDDDLDALMLRDLMPAQSAWSLL